MSMFYELMMKKKGMPSNYQEVEYIESTGTQYIDTGVIPTANTKFICDIAFTDISAGRFGCLFKTRYYFGVASNKFIGANSTTYNHSISDADTNRHIFTIDNSGIYIDNILKYSSTGSYNSDIKSIFLFATHTVNPVQYYSKAKLYSSQIYDNNRLVRNFIPVYDTETQKYGMWESVQGKFYGNAGTGDFKGSIVGYTVVGSPTITDGVVSGFSTSNYVTIPQQNDIENASLELVINATVNNTTDSSLFRFVSSNAYRLQQIGSSGALTYYGKTKYFSTNILVTDFSFFKLKTTNGLENNVEIYASNDGINWQQANITEGTISQTFTNSDMSFGRLFDGSINFNNTYIKINNKLYFNGQQA